MITPSEFLATSNQKISERAAAQLPAIRAAFDMAIRAAATLANTFTVKVPLARDGWDPAAIEAVIEEYQLAGWAADTSDTRYLVQLTAHVRGSL